VAQDALTLGVYLSFAINLYTGPNGIRRDFWFSAEKDAGEVVLLIKDVQLIKTFCAGEA